MIDCASQAKDEALENIQDAIYQCFQVRMEHGLPLTIETRQVEVGVFQPTPVAQYRTRDGVRL
jgi:hypothetical protein